MLKLLRKAVAFEKQRGCFDYFLRSYHHRHTVYKRRNTIQIYGSHTLTMLYHVHEHQRERPVARQVNLCYSVRNPQILPHACADHKIRIPARILLSTRSSNLPIYSFSPRRFRLTTRRTSSRTVWRREYRRKVDHLWIQVAGDRYVQTT